MKDEWFRPKQGKRRHWWRWSLRKIFRQCVRRLWTWWLLFHNSLLLSLGFLILWVLIFWFISVNRLLMRVWLCVVVPIHLFVKIFKKLMYHTDIGGCKVGVNFTLDPYWFSDFAIWCSCMSLAIIAKWTRFFSLFSFLFFNFGCSKMIFLGSLKLHKCMKLNTIFFLVIRNSQLSWPRDYCSLDLNLDDKGFFFFFFN